MKRLITQPNITPVILAGGLGTRLRPVVSDRPKVLSEIRGRYFIAYLLDQLNAAGMDSAVLCTGYKSEMIPAALGPRYENLKLVYSKEPKPLGTCGAVRNALPHIDTGYLMILNGDSFCNIDLQKYMDWFFAANRKAALLLTHMPDVGRYGAVEIAADQRLLRFTEKGGNTGPGWINAGIYIIQKTLLDTVPSGMPRSLEYDFLPGLIGNRVFGYPAYAAFIDIGTPATYRQADFFFGNLPTCAGSRRHAI